MSPTVGMIAPNFTASVDDGSTVSLSDFKGKPVVLYFYPQDDTETCTKQACAFRDNMERLTAKGATVIGVSPDSVKLHSKFKDKYNLNFILVSDEDKSICNKYGVWAMKTLYGRDYMGVVRTTFVINGDGIITHIFTNVRIKGHVDKVLEALQ